MNPYLKIFAGMLRGYASAKQQERALAAKKAAKPQIEAEIQRQKMMNMIVENYLRQQGYGQMNLETPPETPSFDSSISMQQDKNQPVYKSTKSILEEMGRPMKVLEEERNIDLQQTMPVTNQQYKPIIGQDMLGAALIQGYSKGQIPLFNVMKERQAQSNWEAQQRRYQQKDKFDELRANIEDQKWLQEQKRLIAKDDFEGQKYINSLIQQNLENKRNITKDILDVNRYKENVRQYEETQNRLKSEAEQQQRNIEERVTPMTKMIDGVEHTQFVDFRGQPVGEPIKTGEKKPLSPEVAGKIQGAKDMREAADAIRGALVNKDGSVNRWRIAEMAGEIPFSEGRSLVPHVENVLAATLHLESGAAFGQGEVRSAAKRFIPSVLDSPEQVKYKINLMKRYSNGVLTLLDPNKTYGTETIIVTSNDGRKWALQPGDQDSGGKKPKNINTADDFYKSMGINPKSR